MIVARRSTVLPDATLSVLDQLLAAEQELAGNRANVEAECAAIVDAARSTAAEIVRTAERELERELVNRTRADNIVCADEVRAVEEEGRRALDRYEGIPADTLLRIAEEMATRVTGLAPCGDGGKS